MGVLIGSADGTGRDVTADVLCLHGYLQGHAVLLRSFHSAS